MGGSSKSSSQQQTTYIDERIGATDGAIVAREGSTVSVLDGGAIEQAFDFGLESLSSNEQIVLTALEYAANLGTGALQSIGANADQAFEFVDKQRQDDMGRSYREIVPWLVAGASIVAISMTMRK
jgi:hypothetical protein